MIMCVLLCYPVSIHMSQLQATGHPISSLNYLFTFSIVFTQLSGFIKIVIVFLCSVTRSIGVSLAM